MVTVNPPDDLELRAVWDLAVETKGEPTTRAVAEAVIAEYHALLEKAPALTRHLTKSITPAPIAVPRRGQLVIELDESLSPFAQRLAAVLLPTPANARGLRVRIVTAPAAAHALPQICVRQGIAGKPFTYVRQRDGRLTASWVDEPEFWVKEWAARSGAIILLDDRAGPSELRFVTQISDDTVKTIMRVGDDGSVSRELGRAYWDIGIRRFVAEVPKSLVATVASESRVSRFAATGLTMRMIDRGEVFEQISTRTERP